MVQWGFENQLTAARNQLADFANRLGRRGKLSQCEGVTAWSVMCFWNDTLKPKEGAMSGIRKIVAVAVARNGKMAVQVELTKERLDYVKANCPSSFKHGKMGVTGVVTYEGETAEECINKMKRDGINVPPEKDFTRANRKRLGKINKAREAVIQRLVAARVISERAAHSYLWYPFDPVDEAEAAEVLNDPQKWNNLANNVRTKLESTPAWLFDALYGVTKEEALAQ